MNNSYTKGTEVRLSAVFDVNNAPQDPSTVIFKVMDPLGNITTSSGAAVIKDSTGNYHVDILVATCGVWWYRVEGTGVATAAQEAQFDVRPSVFP